MSQKILLQTILRLQDEIKTGAANFMDVSAEYFKSTGNFLDDSQKSVALQEINKIAPSNVVEDVFTKAEGIDSTSLKDNLMKTDNPFSDLVKTTEEGPKTLDQRRADAIKELGSDKPVSGKINYPLVEKQLGVKLRGNETFDELLEIEKNTKESRQGLGSLYPKGGMSEEIKRDDLAGFMREMRKAGIKNEDVMDVAKITDVAGGKRAATTLARAADMGADTKIKQEFLSDLDEKVMNNGPRYFQEEFQGYDSYGELIQNESSRIRNAIVDDLEELGVDEEKVSNILTYANDVAKKNPYQPEAFIDAIKQDIELEGIKYNMSFWENYISKILELSAKAEPRFAGGGLV